MYLVLIAWLYVTLLMAVAEATSPAGSVMGAIITFTLYGLLPMGIGDSASGSNRLQGRAVVIESQIVEAKPPVSIYEHQK